MARTALQASIVLDPASVGHKVVVLKTHYPRLDLVAVLAKKPKLLLQAPQQLERSAKHVSPCMHSFMASIHPSCLAPSPCRLADSCHVRFWWHDLPNACACPLPCVRGPTSACFIRCMRARACWPASERMQVCQMLSRARDVDRLVGLVPELLEPKECISILITVTKWCVRAPQRPPIPQLASPGRLPHFTSSC